MTAADGRPVVVVASDVLWDGPWGTQQHLAVGLSRHFRVLFLEMPVSVTSPLRNPARARQLLQRLRTVDDSLAVAAPVGVPPQDRPAMRNPNAARIARFTVRALRRLGWPLPSVLVAGYLYAWRMVPRLGAPPLVALVCDTPPDGALLADVEWASMFSRADAAVVTSPPLRAAVAGLGLAVCEIGQGVDAAGIAAAAADGEAPGLVDVARPRVGYVGTITSRIDAALVRAVAAARPDWRFVFVGARRQVHHDADDSGFDDLDNVVTVGERPRDELGRWLAGFDAAWVPYDFSPFNTASNPLKVMEYLAAGVPTVAPAFPALAATSPHTSLVPDADVVHWLAALDAAVADTDPVAADARRAYATANDWTSKADEVAAFLTDRLPARPT